ncbi:MAG: hypothetical protein E6I37_00250 [Chloroflexi bacterium]|nr:MAG: hypothetical protein E6I37_00250 [Chloroflexota bacterium]
MRVGILAVLAGITYPTWWTWQLFKFTRREGFPRASSFWWTLIPIVGVVMVWRQLDDLKKAAGSKARVHPKLIVALLVAGSLALQAGRLANRSLGGLLLILLLAFLLTGFAIYLAQRSITSYLRATYPLERERRLSVGEVAATLLSLLLSAAVGGLLYYWTVADAGPVISYLPAASPVTDLPASPGWAAYRNTDPGFTIQLPAGWASVSYDLDAQQENPTKVIKRENGSPTSLDRFARNAAAAQVGGDIQLTEQHRVTLPAGEAVRMMFSETYLDADGVSVTNHYVEYALVMTKAFRSNGYLLRFGVLDAVTDEMQSTIDQIVSTFRVL